MHAVNLGISCMPAASAESFCSAFAPSLPLSDEAKQLLSMDAAIDPKPAKSVRRWLAAMSISDDGDGGELEATIDHFVGEVLHAADLDGDGLILLPQRNLRARIGEREITTRPYFVVRDTRTDPIVDVVTHNSKVLCEGDLAWAQIGGEMLVAALRNTARLGMQDEAAQIVGIRTIGIRFTFFKGVFDTAALVRLSAGELQPNDVFPVACWGGGLLPHLRQNSGTGRYWGLDFLAPSERGDLLRMITALGNEIRARQPSLALEKPT